MNILVSDPSFEYDVYSLVKAFYPERELTLCRSENDAPIWLRVDIGEDEAVTEICGEGRLPISLGVRGLPRKEVKNVLKRLLYGELSALTGKTLPWGTLTGVRPTKIAFGMLEEMRGDEADLKIASYMRETYLASDKKAALSIDIAKRERSILADTVVPDSYSLYIGIPFCPSICLYCSFASSPIASFAGRTDAYLDALGREIAACGMMFAGRPLSTVYIGGGTPTALSEAQLERLLSMVEEHFNLNGIREYTVEAGRPDSVDEAKLDVLLRHGVDRISINPQTMNDTTLKRIGRAHTASDIKRAYEMARGCGFKTVNMDIITGLPGEGAEEVRHTVTEIKAMSPDALTVHSLAIKRSSRLNLEWEQYKHELMENSQAVMDITRDAALDMGMRPYYLYRQKNIAGNLENIGYSTEGHEGLYNILIMEERQDILALGAGADSKRVARADYSDSAEPDEADRDTSDPDVACQAMTSPRPYDYRKKVSRCENVKDIDAYIARTDEMIARKRVLWQL